MQALCRNCGAPALKSLNYEFCSQDCQKAKELKECEYNKGYEDGYNAAWKHADEYYLGG